MDINNFKKPLKLFPNLRIEDEKSSSGYIWGKSFKESNIMPAVRTSDVKETSIIAERWIVSDDRHFSSIVKLDEKVNIPLFSLLENFGALILGEMHFEKYGPFICSILKIIDTSHNMQKGSLSVQVHPKEGFSGFPSKPEMWKGKGSVYIGWNQDMTIDLIHKGVSNCNLETYMNRLDLNVNDLIIVPGGIVHAIRFDTCLYEWSKSIMKQDPEKGSLRKATIALYDRTDGKSPRPGKEDIHAAIDVMSHADTLKKSENFQSKPENKYLDKNGNRITLLFQTEEVWVEQFDIKTIMNLTSKNMGFPIFVESGNLLVIQNNQIIDIVGSGEERFFPALMKDFQIQADNSGPCTFYKWYKPLHRFVDINIKT